MSMQPVAIETVLTEDNVTLQVAWIAPRDATRPVLLATHGVGNSFTLSGLWRALQVLAARDGWGVAMMNNRGHDWVAMNAGDRRWIGAAYEKIEDSVLDFQAGQRWLRERGHRRIVMAGHSLGGLKACYTQAHHPVDDVVALAMFSSPRLPDDKVWDWAAHQQLMARCEDMVARGRGQELMHVDMPTNTPAMKGLMCYATYINKYGPDAATTALRYADRIRVPAFLLAGDHEKPQLSFSIDMEAALVNAPSVRRVAVEDCDHIYTNRIEQVASATNEWLHGLCR
ncbi:alpha/beta fold hydrolase [Ramlibacter sp. PS3R-8]|uniref:alpha/beta hydrolase n=1 Tax=Ramlibacter sp. PS3R-8 TaxID=3133437 RepID=UPI0030A1584D